MQIPTSCVQPQHELHRPSPKRNRTRISTKKKLSKIKAIRVPFPLCAATRGHRVLFALLASINSSSVLLLFFLTLSFFALVLILAVPANSCPGQTSGGGRLPGNCHDPPVQSPSPNRNKHAIKRDGGVAEGMKKDCKLNFGFHKNPQIFAHWLSDGLLY